MNSRIDVSFGFEEHSIRGLKKDEVSLFGCDVYDACSS